MCTNLGGYNASVQQPSKRQAVGGRPTRFLRCLSCLGCLGFFLRCSLAFCLASLSSFVTYFEYLVPVLT